MESVQADRYGDEVLRVEPHGIDPIAPSERHGKPHSLFTLWFSANLEFATLTVGILSVAVFGLNLWQALISILIGNVVGTLFLGLLTTFGFRWGVPQLIQSRGAFGFIGNFVPATFNFFAGVGWYAVNTVLGVYALLWVLPIGFIPDLILMIVLQAVVSIYGHNLIHWVERASALILAVVFIIISFYAFGHIHFDIVQNIKGEGAAGTVGSFILSIAVSLSYIMGWLTFSSDYSRYLPQNTSVKRAFHSAFWGVLIPCVWLELLGAGLATITFVSKPTDLISALNMPHVLTVITMLAIMLGTITANVLNIYSGSLSLLAIDVRWIRALTPKRWIAALFIGIVGGVLSYVLGQNNYYQNYSNFLLVLAYWVSPWLAVVVMDYFLVRRHRGRVVEFYEKNGTVRGGLWAFIIGLLCSVPFFNQSIFTGFMAKQYPQIGDISYYVSFIVAAILYVIFTNKSRHSSTTAV